MKKTLLYFVLLSTVAFGKIKVKIVEPIRFDAVNVSETSRVTGTGKISIYNDDKTAINKPLKIVVRYVKDGLLSTNNRWIKTKNITLELDKRGDFSNVDEYSPMSGEAYISFDMAGKEVANIAIKPELDLKDLTRTADVEANGLYTGRLKMNVEVYKKVSETEEIKLDEKKEKFRQQHETYYPKYVESWKKLKEANPELFKGATQEQIDKYVYIYQLNNELLNKAKTDFDEKIKNGPAFLRETYNGSKVDEHNIKNDINLLHELIEKDYNRRQSGGVASE